MGRAAGSLDLARKRGRHRPPLAAASWETPSRSLGYGEAPALNTLGASIAETPTPSPPPQAGEGAHLFHGDRPSLISSCSRLLPPRQPTSTPEGSALRTCGGRLQEPR